MTKSTWGGWFTKKDDDQYELDLSSTTTTSSSVTNATLSTSNIFNNTIPTTTNINWNNITAAAGTLSTTLTATPYTITGDSYYRNNSLKVEGDADFNGDVRIKGRSITDLFDNIEKRLAILHPNTELESRWDELKELGERYRELEKEILEKESIWNTLKK